MRSNAYVREQNGGASMRGKTWLAYVDNPAHSYAANTVIPIRMFIGAFAGELPAVRQHLSETYGAKAQQIIVRELDSEVCTVAPVYDGIEAAPIDVLSLSTRSSNALKRMSLFYLGDLMGRGMSDFMALKCIGQRSAEEIICKRDAYLAAQDKTAHCMGRG